jgi:hypothetical protein
MRRWIIGSVAVGLVLLCASIIKRQREKSAHPLPNDSSPWAADKTETDLQLLNHASEEEILAILKQKMDSSLHDEVRALLEFLARTRPLMALDLAQKAGRTDAERYTLSFAALQVWSRNNPEPAWSWTLQTFRQLDLAGQPSLRSCVLDQVAGLNPTWVITLVAEALKQGGAPLNFGETSTAQLALQAMDKAGNSTLERPAIEAWSRDPGYDQIDRAAFEEVAAPWAQHSPTEAAAWLRTLPPSSERNAALAAVAENWAASDPKAAMDWSSGLSAGDDRQNAMQKAFNEWEHTDMLAAAQWLGQQPADPVTDHMIANLVGDPRVTQADPPAALMLAESVSEPRLRGQSLDAVLRTWGREDPTAAEKYVMESTQLSSAQKEQILQRLRHPDDEP